MNITLFKPHKGQKAVIDGFADTKHKFGVVATGRQYGKSLLGQNLMLYWLLKNPKQKGAWISPIYNQGKKVFQELSNASNKIIKQSNKADLTIEFINGSTIQFLSAERYDSIRGFSFNYMVIDEAAFIREEAMNEAVLPTLSAIGKKCLVISTPKSKNWFYNYYLRGNVSNDDYIAFKGVSTDNPYVSQDFILEQQKSLPIDIYRQEYLAQFSEATNDVFRGLDNVCNLNTFINEDRNRKHYIGIDVGFNDDFTVCAIFEEGGRCKNILRFNGTSFEEAGKTIVDNLKRYNVVGGYCETNSIGQAIFELIQPHNRKIKPFYTSQDRKTRGVRALIQDIEEGVLELPSKELMPECYNELAGYTYKVNTNGKLSFSHMPGQHDDIVDALWLANLSRSELANKGGQIYIGNFKK
jgi:hypothetical protein